MKIEIDFAIVSYGGWLLYGFSPPSWPTSGRTMRVGRDLKYTAVSAAQVPSRRRTADNHLSENATGTFTTWRRRDWHVDGCVPSLTILEVGALVS